MSQPATQQTGNTTRVIDLKFALVCQDVLEGIPAKTSCLKHGLNYNTFHKRVGKQAVRTLRNENGAGATTATAPTPSSEESDATSTVSITRDSSPSARKGA